MLFLKQKSWNRICTLLDEITKERYCAQVTILKQIFEVILKGKYLKPEDNKMKMQ